jgi:hypothetical protein
MMAVEESLHRALYLGNLELNESQIHDLDSCESEAWQVAEDRRSRSPFCDRRIYVRVQLSPAEARFTIRNEGPGAVGLNFYKRGDDHPALTDENRCDVLMHSFMDEVTLSDDGNEVTLVKRRPMEPNANSDMMQSQDCHSQ